jgi:hypothetical protein
LASRTARFYVVEAVECTKAVAAIEAQTAVSAGAALGFLREKRATAAEAAGTAERPVWNFGALALSIVCAQVDKTRVASVAVGIGETFHTHVDATDHAVATVVVTATIGKRQQNAVAAGSDRPVSVLNRNAEQAFLQICTGRAGWAVGVTAARALARLLTDVIAALLVALTIAVETARRTRWGVFEEEHISGRVRAANAAGIPFAGIPFDRCSTRHWIEITPVVETAARDSARIEGDAVLIRLAPDAFEGVIAEIPFAIVVVTAVGPGNVSSVTAETAEPLPRFLIGYWLAGARLTGRAGTAVVIVRTYACGDDLAIEGWACAFRIAHFAAAGAPCRVRILIHAGAVDAGGCSAAAARLTAIGRPQFIVAIEHADAIDTRFAVTAVVNGLIQAEAKPAFAAARAVGIDILTETGCGIARPAFGSAAGVTSGTVGYAHTTETPQTESTGVALVTLAVSGARADTVATDVAETSRILSAVRNVAASKSTEDILDAFATGSAKFVRIEGHHAGAIGAAEGSAALPFVAALLRSGTIAVEDALSVATAFTFVKAKKV